MSYLAVHGPYIGPLQGSGRLGTPRSDYIRVYEFSREKVPGFQIKSIATKVSSKSLCYV